MTAACWKPSLYRSYIVPDSRDCSSQAYTVLNVGEQELVRTCWHVVGLRCRRFPVLQILHALRKPLIVACLIPADVDVALTQNPFAAFRTEHNLSADVIAAQDGPGAEYASLAVPYCEPCQTM